jgi:hypothetical protein
MADLKHIINNKHLFRALSSVGYNHVGNIDNEIIYTNDRIKSKFIESISSQDTFKPIMDTVIKLIDLNVVVPANIKQGLINKIVYLFFKNKKKFAKSDHMVAFFDRESGKIFCLIENIEEVNYWKKSEMLSLVLLHEFQHMTATVFPISFMRLHSKSLITYYKKFFELFFKADVSDKVVYKVINWIHSKLETTTGTTLNTSTFLTEYHNLLWNTLRPSYENTAQLEIDLHRFFRVLIKYLQGFNDYTRALHSKDINCISMYISLRDAYKSLKVMNHIDSLFIQELLAPSEVICIESEYNTQTRHFKLITQIKK